MPSSVLRSFWTTLFSRSNPKVFELPENFNPKIENTLRRHRTGCWLSDLHHNHWEYGPEESIQRSRSFGNKHERGLGTRTSHPDPHHPWSWWPQMGSEAQKEKANNIKANHPRFQLTILPLSTQGSRRLWSLFSREKHHPATLKEGGNTTYGSITTT